jgi:signal transduction histidine kinase
VTARSGLPGSWQVPASPYIEGYAIGGSWVRGGPQSECMFGYTPDETEQPNFWKTILHPADRDRVLAEDEWCERNLEPWRGGGRLPQQTRAELLQGVTAGARRLERLLTDLIDLERLGWGAVTLERQPVDLAPLLERAAVLHGGTAWVEDRPGGGSSFCVVLPGPPR